VSSLFGMLHMGAGAYNAFSLGVGVAGHNIANVATEGHSRQSVLLNSDSIIGGVLVDGVLRSESHLLSGRERDAMGSLGYSASSAQALLDLDGELAAGDDNLVDGLSTMFGNLVDLSSSPLDPTLRQQVIDGADALATAFNRASNRVSDAIARADGRVSMLADEATTLASQIAAANKALAAKFDPTLADQRDQAAKELAELVGGEARIDPDGHMRFVTSGGAVLVHGDRASSMEAVPDAALDGRMRIDIVDGPHRTDVTSSLGGGKIAGELAFRDGAAVQTGERIDQLAFDFANAINAVHSAHEAPDGTTGLDLFVTTATADGAAAAFAIDATVAADPGLLATAATGAGAGDTTGLLAMIDLREQSLASGNSRTFTEEAIGTLASVGSQAQQAQGAHDLELARNDALASLRDSLSGVSLEEEMMRLSQMQRSAEAASTFISTVDEMLTNLIATL